MKKYAPQYRYSSQSSPQPTIFSSRRHFKLPKRRPMNCSNPPLPHTFILLMSGQCPHAGSPRSLLPNDPNLKHQAVVVEVDEAELRVVNIYTPPTNSCHPKYSPDLTGLFSFTDDTLIGVTSMHMIPLGTPQPQTTGQPQDGQK